MGQPLTPAIRIFDTIDELATALSREFAEIATKSILEKNEFAFVLAGGETPKAVYRRLAADYSNALAWEKVMFFLGDERYLPHTSPQSNFRMARETLLNHLPIDEKNIFPIPTHFRRPEDAAADYEKTLRSKFQGQWPRFDLVLLGLGADCHTASLFPGSPALQEKSKWVAVSESPVEPKTRLTLTFPAINHAANVFLIVTGEKKAAALLDVLSGHMDVDSCPAAGVKPIDGSLTWWLDKEAAALLDSKRIDS
jgi:6-phosphogluconolactonase